MKFINFKYQENNQLGILTKDEKNVIKLSSILPEKSFDSMIQMIQTIKNEEIQRIKDYINQDDYLNQEDGDWIPCEKITLCAPIERPIHDIICVGVNYKAHLEETKDSIMEGGRTPKKTVYFAKRAIRIIGTGDQVVSRLDLDDELDYEVELAVIIGKDGMNIPVDQVEEHIFGYSVFNDFSSRKLQREHVQWYLGKSLDTYSAMGPSILHKSELPFPVEVDIKSKVNDEVRQSSNTSLFLTGIPELISEFSMGIPLEAGDIIITGTPSGVGMGYHPPKFLKKGDTVTCMIPPIGTLVNIIK